MTGIIFRPAFRIPSKRLTNNFGQKGISMKMKKKVLAAGMIALALAVANVPPQFRLKKLPNWGKL